MFIVRCQLLDEPINTSAWELATDKELRTTDGYHRFYINRVGTSGGFLRAFRVLSTLL